MAATLRIVPQEEPVCGEATLKVGAPKPKPVSQKPAIEDVLVDIFGGYEEFLESIED